MRAAIYARRSTDEHQEASLDVQISGGKGYIETKGWTLDPANIFVDDAVSRAEFKKRPGLISMLNAAEEKRFDVVVCRDETRLGGDVNRTGLVIQDLLDAGVRLRYYFTDEEVVHDNATAKFMCAARNFAAELEREKTSQRTREHLATKAKRGLNVGGRTYGYDNVEIKEGDRRVRVEYHINPQQAAIVREICTRYANGEGLKSIAKDLNMRGIESPRGKGWAQSALLPMISRERYRGILTWGKVAKGYRGGTKVRRDAPSKDWVTVEMPELRIIDDDLWEAVQARVGRKARYGHHRRGGAPSKYLLVGLSRCSTCGGRMAITNGRSSYDAVKVYVCSNFREKRTCTNSLRRPAPAVDQAVLAWVEQHILTESVITTVL